MLIKIVEKEEILTSPSPGIKPDIVVDIGQNTIVEPEPTNTVKKEEAIQENESEINSTEKPNEQEKSDQMTEPEEEESTNAAMDRMDGGDQEGDQEEEQQPEENAEGDQQMENESDLGGTSVSISGGGGVVIGGDMSGMSGMGDMGDMGGTESGTAAIQSPLASVPFMLEITGITAVLAIIVGVLLAVRKIKKGFELYED